MTRTITITMTRTITIILTIPITITMKITRNRSAKPAPPALVHGEVVWRGLVDGRAEISFDGRTETG